MGSHYLEMIIKTQSEKRFKKLYDQAVESDRIQYGNDQYSGSWATIPQVRIVSDPFSGKKWTKKKFKEVSDWISVNTEKWEPAKAVKSTKGYIVGGWAIS